MLHQITTINCKGRLLNLERPIVMGVLNVTPDSFYDGGRYHKNTVIEAQVGKMLEEGASIIDIGGMSSRPGAQLITVEEELKRVIHVIEFIHDSFPEAIISVDTIRSKVALEAVNAGASIVNDISAGRIDAQMYRTVKELGVPYILMHMQKKPEKMQIDPQYKNITLDILDFFIAELGKIRELGIIDVLIDPGFGFGKTIENNYELLSKLHVFKMLEVPILVGLSRKSMIYKVLDTIPDQALNGTTALHMVALQQGAKILRVHDVKPAVETIILFEQLERLKGSHEE